MAEFNFCVVKSLMLSLSINLNFLVLELFDRCILVICTAIEHNNGGRQLESVFLEAFSYKSVLTASMLVLSVSNC